MLPVFSQSEAELAACFVQDIAALVESFSEKDTAGKQSLQQMLSSDQAAFRGASIQVLAHATGSSGSRYLLHLLRKHNLLIDALLDPRAKRETVVAAARKIPGMGAPIDADLERVLGVLLSGAPSAANTLRVLRLLEVLEAASPLPRFYLFQAELMGYPDSAVRSKSALLIGRSSKSVAVVGRMLLDEDARVQANAVESLWTFAPAAARPLLLTAARSRNPRVAGNAAVGLYRVGDLSSLTLLFSMAREDDPARRITAAWAMGETGDPRFLPFLAAWFPASSGGERVNILQALGRIRRREKSLTETGTIEIRSWDVKADGAQWHLVLSLRSAEKPELNHLKATEFSIWAGGTLVEDYHVLSQPNPALAISGFVLPRFSSAMDPYGRAVGDAIARCLAYKRADDLWRLDRYLTEPRTDESAAPLEKAALPYDDAVLGAYAKSQQRGFLAAPEGLRRIVESPGSKERAADDVIAAFERQSDAMIKFSGKRRLFLFLAPDAGFRVERHIARLMAFVTGERITLHGFAPKGASGCDDFERLCLASAGGSFADVAPEPMVNEVERIYAQSLNRFEVACRVPDGSETAEGRVRITTESGCGQASFCFPAG